MIFINFIEDLILVIVWLWRRRRLSPGVGLLGVKIQRCNETCSPNFQLKTHNSRTLIICNIGCGRFLSIPDQHMFINLCPEITYIWVEIFQYFNVWWNLFYWSSRGRVWSRKIIWTRTLRKEEWWFIRMQRNLQLCVYYLQSVIDLVSAALQFIHIQVWICLK